MDFTIRIKLDAPAGWKRRVLLYVAVPLGLLVAATAVAVADDITTDWIKPSAPISSDKLQGNLSGLQAQIHDLQQQIVPAGTIVSFGGGGIPAGWMLCDGRAAKSSDYPALFAVIGQGWGKGTEGKSGPPDVVGADFNFPDLRGRFLRGVDLSSGHDPGAGSRDSSKAGGNTGPLVGTLETGSTALPQNGFQLSNSGKHSHQLADNDDKSEVYANVGGVGSGSHLNQSTSGAGDHSHTVSGGDAETRPANAAVTYIIKL